MAIASDLLCNNGTILGFLSGLGGQPHVFEDTKSYAGQESSHFTIPASASGTSNLSEGRVAVIWFSDTDYDEWIIGPITKTRGPGAFYDVTCRPITYKLTDCGFVKTIKFPPWECGMVRRSVHLRQPAKRIETLAAR